MRIMRRFIPLFGLVLLVGVANAAPRTVTLAVRYMNCGTCPYAVRKALEAVRGVIQAKVDYTTKTATVTFDDAKASVEALTRATANAGYPSTLKP